MSELDQVLDVYAKRRVQPDSKSLENVAVKVTPEVRAEFYAAATELGLPRRELATALFMHGMERLRRQFKSTQKPTPGRGLLPAGPRAANLGDDQTIMD